MSAFGSECYVVDPRKQLNLWASFHLSFFTLYNQHGMVLFMNRLPCIGVIIHLLYFMFSFCFFSHFLNSAGEYKNGINEKKKITTIPKQKCIKYLLRTTNAYENCYYREVKTNNGTETKYILNNSTSIIGVISLQGIILNVFLRILEAKPQSQDIFPIFPDHNCIYLFFLRYPIEFTEGNYTPQHWMNRFQLY